MRAEAAAIDRRLSDDVLNLSSSVRSFLGGGVHRDEVPNIYAADVELARLGDIAKSQPVLARARLEALHEAFGIGTRKRVEEGIRLAEDPYTRKSYEDVLELFRPGESEAVGTPLPVSERLATFSAQPSEVHEAVFRLLSEIPHMSLNDFGKAFGARDRTYVNANGKKVTDTVYGEKLPEILDHVGLGTPESLLALRDVVHAYRVSESRIASEFNRISDAEPKAGTSELNELISLLDRADAEAKAAKNPRKGSIDEPKSEPETPASLLISGIEAVKSRLSENSQTARIDSINRIASLPTPERMAVLFGNKLDQIIKESGVSGLAVPETGSPEWFKLSTKVANDIVNTIRAHEDSVKGQPNYAKLEAEANALAADGYTKDFFQSIAPEKDLFETDVVLNESDLQAAYDPEAVIREGLAQQEEGLNACYA